MNDLITDNIEKRYMKEIRKYLPFILDNRQIIVSNINKGVRDYIYDHQITDYDSLIIGFGVPYEVVDRYITASPSLIRRQNKRFAITVLAISVVLVCAITSGLSYFYYTNTPAYIVIEPAVEIDAIPSDAIFETFGENY